MLNRTVNKYFILTIFVFCFLVACNQKAVLTQTAVRIYFNEFIAQNFDMQELFNLKDEGSITKDSPILKQYESVQKIFDYFRTKLPEFRISIRSFPKGKVIFFVLDQSPRSLLNDDIKSVGFCIVKDSDVLQDGYFKITQDSQFQDAERIGLFEYENNWYGYQGRVW